MFRKEITVIIADDHHLLLSGLEMELKNYGYTVLAKATDGAMAFQKIVTHKPKVALLDISMPNMTGLEVVAACQNINLSTKFILLSFHKEAGFVAQAKKQGVHGYLSKEDPFKEVDYCIQEVINGKTYFSELITKNSQGQESQLLSLLQLLTPSEVAILKLISQGKTSTEIAEQKFVSKRTIDKHRANIIHKLELSDSVGDWAQKNKVFIDGL